MHLIIQIIVFVFLKHRNPLSNLHRNQEKTFPRPKTIPTHGVEVKATLLMSRLSSTYVD